jgi:hypothetical protein
MLAAIGSELTGDEPVHVPVMDGVRLSETVVLVTYVTEVAGRATSQRAEPLPAFRIIRAV